MEAKAITDDLFARLRSRYSGGGVVLLEGVGNGAGFGNSGWSDAIAMSTWPSKGLILYGFEVKATRSDWLRELDKPGKNAEWQDACHEWYVVAPADVVKLPELPRSWGLLIPKGADGLRIASRSERDTPPTLTLDLVAAVFRAAETSRTDAIRPIRERLHEEIEAKYRSDIDDANAKRSEMAERYDGLKRALGDSWDDLDRLTVRAKALRALDDDRLGRDLRAQERSLIHAARRVRDARLGLAQKQPDDKADHREPPRQGHEPLPRPPRKKTPACAEGQGFRQLPMCDSTRVTGKPSKSSST